MSGFMKEKVEGNQCGNEREVAGIERNDETQWLE